MTAYLVCQSLFSYPLSFISCYGGTQPSSHLGQSVGQNTFVGRQTDLAQEGADSALETFLKENRFVFVYAANVRHDTSMIYSCYIHDVF